MSCSAAAGASASTVNPRSARSTGDNHQAGRRFTRFDFIFEPLRWAARPFKPKPGLNHTDPAARRQYPPVILPAAIHSLFRRSEHRSITAMLRSNLSERGGAGGGDVGTSPSPRVAC